MKHKEYKTKSGKAIRLWQGDCMELMDGKPENNWDLAIVDPPYGENDAINRKSNKNKYQAKRGDYKEFDNVKPDYSYFAELKRVNKRWMVWGGNYFNQITGGVVAWDKNGTAFGEGEVAICNTHKSVRFYEYTWNGMLQEDMKNKEERIHQNQKPVQLYRWMLTNYAKGEDTILDTHGGSMSLAIACYMEDYELDIIELDEDHYKNAVQRFEQHIRQKVLF